MVRGNEFGLVVLAALIGCLGGLAVAAMSVATQVLRETLYGLPPGNRLSGMSTLPPLLVLIGPAIGGALLALFTAGATRLRGPRRGTIVDPIEANALHGGRMSLRDSACVVCHNVISNGCGASVGLATARNWTGNGWRWRANGFTSAD